MNFRLFCKMGIMGLCLIAIIIPGLSFLNCYSIDYIQNKVSNSKQRKIKTYLNKTKYYLKLANIDSSYYYIQKANSLAEPDEFPVLYVRCNNLLVNILNNKDQYEEAIDIGEEILDFGREKLPSDKKPMLPTTLIYLSQSAIFQREYDIAFGFIGKTKHINHRFKMIRSGHGLIFKPPRSITAKVNLRMQLPAMRKL